MLSGLGSGQLDRSVRDLPGAEAYVLVFPERLVIDVRGYPRWRGITWEHVLDAYRRCGHPWLATSAEAWRAHLDRSLPTVRADTVWNDLAESDDFTIALRARMAWVHHQMNRSNDVQHDLVQSAAGNSAVIRLYADTPVDGYQIMVDVEESLSVRAFRGTAQEPRSTAAPGPRCVCSRTG